MPKSNTATNTEIATPTLSRASRSAVRTRENCGEVGHRDEQKQGANKAEILLGMQQAHLFDLVLNRRDHDFKEALPA